VASTADAQKITRVSVKGEVAAIPGDSQATEAAVKRDARRKAVEQGAGVLVESNTIVRNFQMVSDEIASSAKGVLTEENWGPVQVKDGVATVSLDAAVSPAAIEDAICTVVKANHDPRISLVFVEKAGDEDQPWVNAQAQRGMIEALFTGSFIDNCFTIVESGVKVTEVSANGDLPQATIDEIVKNANAQYVLLGQGKITKASGGQLLSGKMKSYSVSASVKLIATETNVVEAVAGHQVQILGLSPEHAMKANANTKGRVLVGSVMDELFKKIAERWSNDLANASSVQVTVRGVKNFKAAKSFRQGIEALPAVGKVHQRKLSGGVAILDVECDGGSDAFALAVDEKKFGKETVEVLEVTPGKVIINLN
jgi:hypothetical protein